MAMHNLLQYKVFITVYFIAMTNCENIMSLINENVMHFSTLIPTFLITI